MELSEWKLVTLRPFLLKISFNKSESRHFEIFFALYISKFYYSRLLILKKKIFEEFSNVQSKKIYLYVVFYVQILPFMAFRS